ncbi:histone H2B [Nematocida sp. AWRm80]|nr:histone H2B [Nematocida sp. AWRm80]
MKSNANIAEKRVPTPAGKAPAKGISSSEKRKKKATHAPKSYYNFRSSIKRMFKSAYQVAPPQVSGPVIESLCNITCDILDTVASECETLAKKVGKQTVNLEEVLSATQVNLIGELRAHAIKEIKEAVAKVPSRSAK